MEARENAAIDVSIIAAVDLHIGVYGPVAIAMAIALIGGRSGMISAATASVGPPIHTGLELQPPHRSNAA